jgi:NADPH2:quinone reductase
MPPINFFDVLKSGKVKVDVQQKFDLADIGKAHASVSERKTIGTTIIIP